MLLIESIINLIIAVRPLSKFVLNITYVERMEDENRSPFFLDMKLLTGAS